ncbi:MAG: DUF2017 family protein [Acidimicrobiales bacterium]
MNAPFRRQPDGRYAVKLDPGVRALLATMADQLSATVNPGEEIARRLFPPAYPAGGDADAERAYRMLVDDALVNHHRRAFSILAGTAQLDVLTEPELHAWLSAIGSLRLLLGTRLDVSEDMTPPDPEDPAAPEYSIYDVLSQLQYLLVEIVASELPDEGRPEGIL